MPPNNLNKQQAKAHIENERSELLESIDQFLKGPITFLSFIWLGVTIAALFHPHNRTLVHVIGALWIVFVSHFLLEFVVAPKKVSYLKGHWITAVSLLLPALGLFRVVPVLQSLLAFHSGGYFVLLQLVSSANRGTRALGQLIKSRGLGYVLGLALIIIFGGAAGMQYFESPAAVKAYGGTGIASFGDALWFSSMQITTAGSAYAPVTAEGRVITFLITSFGLCIGGYVTAAVATYLVGEDRKRHEAAQKRAARATS